MKTIIYLTGARASGKTTLGRLLGQALDVPFVDTDIHMLDQSGLSVAQVVEKEGWEGFRRREAAALREVAAPGRVVATGGGAILAPANREHMRRTGIVLYLKAPAAVLAARLLADPDPSLRPSLTGKSVVEELEETLSERRTLYESVAHHIVDATPPIEEVLMLALDACRDVIDQ